MIFCEVSLTQETWIHAGKDRLRDGIGMSNGNGGGVNSLMLQCLACMLA